MYHLSSLYAFALTIDRVQIKDFIYLTYHYLTQLDTAYEICHSHENETGESFQSVGIDCQ